MLERSEIFLTQTKKFLDNWIELGHDTCHRTHGYDAEKCQEDCKDRGKSDFAKKCEKKGGLFKCCIRQVQFSKATKCHTYIHTYSFLFQARQGVLP